MMTERWLPEVLHFTPEALAEPEYRNTLSELKELMAGYVTSAPS